MIEIETILEIGFRRSAFRRCSILYSHVTRVSDLVILVSQINSYHEYRDLCLVPRYWHHRTDCAACKYIQILREELFYFYAGLRPLKNNSMILYNIFMFSYNIATHLSLHLLLLLDTISQWLCCLADAIVDLYLFPITTRKNHPPLGNRHRTIENYFYDLPYYLETRVALLSDFVLFLVW